MKLEPSDCAVDNGGFHLHEVVKPELFVVSVSDQLSGIAPAVTVFDQRTLFG